MKAPYVWIVFWLLIIRHVFPPEGSEDLCYFSGVSASKSCLFRKGNISHCVINDILLPTPYKNVSIITLFQQPIECDY